MKSLLGKRGKKAGLPPESLVYVGEKKTEKVKINLINYNEINFEEKEIKKIDDCQEYKSKPLTWINVEGVHDVTIIEKLGKDFEIHPLVLEDILNTDQRPKKEDFINNIFIVLKMLSLNKNNEIISEQVSMVVAPGYLITFQEGIEGDVFNPIRERIRNNKGAIRKLSVDYLAYSLLDAIIDKYFLIIERIGEKIELIESEIIKKSFQKHLHEIHKTKQEVIFLRKSIWPLREVISSLERDDSLVFKETTRLYFRDLFDHTIHIVDNLESLREMLSAITEIYLSNLSNKLNETIRVLTIISTLFIPPTFVVGIYGMNFKYQPELEWKWGYPAVMIFIILVSLSMFFYFKKKRWI